MRNLSTNSSLVVKINVFTGCAVPILSYCSQAWYPNIAALKEKIQKIAMRCVFNFSTGGDSKNWGNWKCYRFQGRFRHDLLLILKLLDGDYNVCTENVIKITEKITIRKAFCNEMKITEMKHSKCNDNFFRRAAILHNIFLRFTKPLELPMDKSTIMRISWQYFDDCFLENLLCTRRLLCKCGHCNQHGKLKTIQDQHWRVQTLELRL